MPPDIPAEKAQYGQPSRQERLEMTIDDSPLGEGSTRGSIENFESLARRVGNTSLLKIHAPPGAHARLLVKLEGENPTGSVKDRACVAMLAAMTRDPGWTSAKTVLDATSGNMGCSIAYFGRAMGARVHIVSSSRLTTEKHSFIKYFGGSVEAVGQFTIEGNRYCSELAKSEPGKWHFLDQLHNTANPMAHVTGTGPEILAQAPGVTAVIGSIGSGGTLLGVGRYLKQVNAQIKIFAVEAASGTRLPGTAALIDGDYRTPFIEEGFAQKIFDSSIQVSEAEAVEMARQLGATGLFGGLQTCAVIAGAWRIIETHGLQGDVVVISGDTGWKNIGVLTSKVPVNSE
jgi:cysteine synthase